MPLAIGAVFLGLLMALTHNTYNDLVVGSLMATFGGLYLFFELA